MDDNRRQCRGRRRPRRIEIERKIGLLRDGRGMRSPLPFYRLRMQQRLDQISVVAGPSLGVRTLFGLRNCTQME
jgi:hypothetical protein